MSFMPFQILATWLRGLFALLLLGAAAWLLYAWNASRETYIRVERPVSSQELERSGVSPGDSAPTTSEFRRVDWEFGMNRETAYLIGGCLLTLWGLGGRWLSPTILRRRGDAKPNDDLKGEVRHIIRPDGSSLHVELFGSADAPPLVLTHGWGLDGHSWYYTKKVLSDRYRLIVWDLPGLGRSDAPKDNDYSLEGLANDLGAVLTLAGNVPAILVGHSIGGMITLTFCRLFPEALGTRVCGLVIAHSTYTNPVETTKGAAFYTAIQNPVLKPLCHLMVWLAPLVWLMNWLSYLNGSAHRSTEKSSFSGRETSAELNYLARYYIKAWPAVIARGQLAMFGYNASESLATIPIPTLVITGDADSTCKPDASAVISGSIPRSKLMTLEPARHCGFFEQHATFNDALKEFVTSCFRARAKAAS